MRHGGLPFHKTHSVLRSLKGTIPDSIKGLVHLTYLDLAYNSISGTIPSDLGLLVDLTSLSFYDNSISGTIPTQIGLATDLTKLDLASNQLSGSIPTELAYCTGLSDGDGIYVDSNTDLCGTIPAAVASLSMSYSDTSIGTPCPTPAPTTTPSPTLSPSLTVAPSVTFAPTHLPTPDTWDYNGLSAFYVAMGGESWSDNSGWMNGDPCTTSWSNVYCYGARVTSLYLNSGNMKGSIPSEIAALKDLTYLSFASGNITSPLPTELGLLSELTEFHIASNHLPGTLPTEIFSLTKLIELRLNSNDLSGELPTQVIVAFPPFPPAATIPLFGGRRDHLSVPARRRWEPWQSYRSKKSTRTLFAAKSRAR